MTVDRPQDPGNIIMAMLPRVLAAIGIAVAFFIVSGRDLNVLIFGVIFLAGTVPLARPARATS